MLRRRGKAGPSIAAMRSPTEGRPRRKQIEQINGNAGLRPPGSARCEATTGTRGSPRRMMLQHHRIGSTPSAPRAARTVAGKRWTCCSASSMLPIAIALNEGTWPHTRTRGTHWPVQGFGTPTCQSCAVTAVRAEHRPPQPACGIVALHLEKDAHAVRAVHRPPQPTRGIVAECPNACLTKALNPPPFNESCA